MNLVLLSGGSGKRLWPLSNDSRSKQFLRILAYKENKNISMVQRVWNQLQLSNLSDSTVIATSSSQVEMIQSQLGFDVPLIVEPERRDTFPAIALAATYLYSIKGINTSEIVTILPVDPYVDSEFFNRIKDLEKTINKTQADIALIGVKPTYPSEKYGYILPNCDTSTREVISVKSFSEKPTKEKAEQFLKEKALWNCGVFAFKLGYIINELQDKGYPISFNELLKQYSSLPKISFDYEIVETANKVVALPYDGYWKDLGTWNTITDEMKTNIIGKGIISVDSENTHLVNELDIPITILGISNAVIAASPDGILVTDKESSPRVKNVMKDFEQRPMFEERRWGWYKVLDHTKFEDGKEVLTKKIGINSGCNLSYQIHNKRSETWTIIKGEGEFVLNGIRKNVKAGDVLQIPVKAQHAIKANTDLEIIEVQTGTELIEEDILRIYLSWEDIAKNCMSLTK